MLKLGDSLKGNAPTDTLTEVEARDGLRVAKLNGKATASTMYPGQEAERWVNLLSPTTFLNDDVLYVVGVGSGWHLNQLLEKDPGRHIVGIDVSTELIQFARPHVQKEIELVTAHFPESLNLNSGDADFKSWFAQAGLSELIRPAGRTYRVIAHRLSLQREARLGWIEEALLGRTPRSFAEHLRLRPELASQLRPHVLAELATCPLLSVKNLQRAWGNQSESCVERRVFRILEELVRL